jgi:hypothetical protein
MINYDLLKLLGVLSIAVVWWVAVWGICDHCIALLKKYTVLTDIAIYCILIVLVYAALRFNPEIIQHL